MGSENAYISQYLTNFAVDGPLTQRFISDMIAPPVPVKKKDFQYKTYTRQYMKSVESAWPKGSTPNFIEEDASWTAGVCIRHALDEKYDDEDVRYFEGPGSLEENLAVKTKEAVLLQKEIALSTYMSTAGNFTNTATPSNLWDTASADFLGDLATAQSAVQLGSGGRPGNTLVIPRQVFLKIQVMDQVLSWKQRNGIEAINEQALSAMTGIPQIVIGEAVYDSAAKDASDTNTSAWVWGKDAWLLYVSPRPTNESLHWGTHFVQQGSDGIVKKIYDDDSETRKVRYQKNYVFTRINNTSGYLFDAVIS